MLSLIGKKVLITTSNWFYAPDGKQYRAVYGTLESINEAGKHLGFIPNRSHANWFLKVGTMNIMGCQVMYVLECPSLPNLGEAEDWQQSAEVGVKSYMRPSHIYEAK